MSLEKQARLECSDGIFHIYIYILYILHIIYYIFFQGFLSRLFRMCTLEDIFIRLRIPNQLYFMVVLVFL